MVMWPLNVSVVHVVEHIEMMAFKLETASESTIFSLSISRIVLVRGTITFWHALLC